MRLALLLLLSFSLFATAQTGGQFQNLQRFDERPFHFGFGLGYNQSSFATITHQSAFAQTDSLLGIVSVSKPGFHFAGIFELKVTKNVRMRLYPFFLEFRDALLQYHYRDSNDLGEVHIIHQELHPTYFSVPLHLKFRTNRIGNFAANVVTGVKYGVNVSSQNNVQSKDLLKLKKEDWVVEVGGGVEFFLAYFKLGVELKYAHGLKNVMVQEQSQWSAPINSLKSRSWMFSITFEG